MALVSCRLRRSLELRDPEDEGHFDLSKLSVTAEQSTRYVTERFESSKQGRGNTNYRNLLLSK